LSGIALTPGTYTLAQLTKKGIKNDDISRINVNIGFAVTIYDGDNFTGSSVYYASNTECLPINWDNKASSLKVICLSNDPSTIACEGVAGNLYPDCFSSSVPIIAGSYTSEQLSTAFSVVDTTISGIRVNNGFAVTLYNTNNFTGQSVTFTGPTVVCLSAEWNNKLKSMKVVCLSNPAPIVCAGGVAGGIFDDCDHEGISVGLGNYNSTRLKAMGMPLKAISKVNVSTGFAITLFENDDFTGRSITHTGKLCLSSAWSNMASAIKASCLSSSVQAFAKEEELSLTATADHNRSRIEWVSNTGLKTDFYTVEKFNGTTGDFETVTTQKPLLSDKAEQYVAYDETPQEGDNIYRITISYQNGTKQVSEIKIVNFKSLIDAFIYPNPASSSFNIDLTDYKGLPVEIYLYNGIGQQVLTHKEAKVEQKIVELDITNQEAGTYRVRILSKGKRDVTKALVIAR
jgi:Secretion system C-terminal sorting domain